MNQNAAAIAAAKRLADDARLLAFEKLKGDRYTHEVDEDVAIVLAALECPAPNREVTEGSRSSDRTSSAWNRLCAAMGVKSVEEAVFRAERADAEIERLKHALTSNECTAAVQAHADSIGVPGPNVTAHEDGYDGSCFCRLCLSYGD